MKGRLPILLMSLLALSLVATLAPDAGAQNSGPAAKDVEATTYAVPVTVDGIGILKFCCICVSPSPYPTSDSVIGSEQPASSTPYSSPSRWFCMDYCRGIIQ
jgi:hypothetical protein